MNEVYTITSDNGDEYKLQFTTDRSGVIADALLDILARKGIEVVEMYLSIIYTIIVTMLSKLKEFQNLSSSMLYTGRNMRFMPI